MEPLTSAGRHSSIDIKKQDLKPALIDFESIISTLPQDQGWGKSRTVLFRYRGFWYSYAFLPGIIALVQDASSELFKFHPSDIIICSCMKTGTTWLKALVFSIATRTRFGNILTNIEATSYPLLNNLPHDLIPLLEIDIAQHQKPRDPDLQILSTHIPYTVMPRPITTHGHKIIYIWRDPKDTFISYWHFYNKIKSNSQGDTEPVPLEKAFDLFSRGISSYGSYWDHVLGYWKASQDFPDKVLFLKYEDMMEDTSFYIKMIADFMGFPFSKEEESQGVVEKIETLCSFESLSQLEVNKTGKHRADDAVTLKNNFYFRKGKIEDWKNYLTPEMAHKFDAITHEKFGSTGLIF